MAGVNGWQGHSDVQGLRAQLRTIAFIGAANRLACGRHVNDVAETPFLTFMRNSMQRSLAIRLQPAEMTVN
jgi:hypothetical protein